MIKIAAAKETFEFFNSYVSKHFYNRIFERIKVEKLSGVEINNCDDYDFVIISESTLPKFLSNNRDSVYFLHEYKQFLAGCGGFDRPFVVTNHNEVAGVIINNNDVGNTGEECEFPNFLDFLTKKEKFILIATSEDALKESGDSKFYYLAHLIMSIAHYMPLVAAHQTQYKINLANKTNIFPRDEQVHVSVIKNDQENRELSFDLTFRNTTSNPIEDLEVYFFNTPPTAFKNAHGYMRFISQVNSIGPVAGYYLGNLLPGDSISRRIIYDPSAGNELAIAWNPMQSARIDDDGFGNGCTTKKPEPIPDPFPDDDDDIIIAMTAGCYDAGCSTSHCPPHECRSDYNEDCGCYKI